MTKFIELKAEDGTAIRVGMPPGFEVASAAAYLANITGGYSQDALRSAFDKVVDKNNWKNPIDAEIARDEFAITAEAVVFFTSSMLEVAEDRGATLRVKAAGYYMTVGA